MMPQEPSLNVMIFQVYDISGYTFYTEAQDHKSVYQNSGVTVEALTGIEKSRYYGVLEEIWELDHHHKDPYVLCKMGERCQNRT